MKSVPEEIVGQICRPQRNPRAETCGPSRPVRGQRRRRRRRAVVRGCDGAGDHDEGVGTVASARIAKSRFLPSRTYRTQENRWCGWAPHAARAGAAVMQGRSAGPTICRPAPADAPPKCRAAWGAQPHHRVFLAFGYVRDGRISTSPNPRTRHRARRLRRDRPAPVASAHDRPYAFYRALGRGTGRDGPHVSARGFVADADLADYFLGTISFS